MNLHVEHMLDNAAMASQNRTLIDDPVTRRAIKENVADPLLAEIARLNREIDARRHGK